ERPACRYRADPTGTDLDRDRTAPGRLPAFRGDRS
ncbi:MAG: hypothetical protein AVDCRST_MAG59-4941, partial [uncultured Thermomicrobiales bacterium]